VYRKLAALKASGSLWQWEYGHDRQEERGLAAKSPVRLGRRDDWVAIGGAAGGIVSLAADGSLWFWWRRDLPGFSGYSDQPWLAASRKPTKIENILGAPE
jgi:hypothetical protein